MRRFFGALILALLVLTSCNVNLNDTITKVVGIKTQAGDRLSTGSYIRNGHLVLVLDELYLDDVRNFQNDILYCLRNNIRAISMRMTNGGGPVITMFHVVDLMKFAQSKKIHITAIGEMIIASAAVPIFVQADTRVCSPSTIFLMHPFQGTTSEDSEGNIAQTVQMWEHQYAQIVADRTDFTVDEVLSYLRVYKEVIDYSKDKGADGKYPKKKVIDQKAAFLFTSQEAWEKKMVDRIGGFFGSI